jgi:hypothetical protein
VCASYLVLRSSSLRTVKWVVTVRDTPSSWRRVLLLPTSSCLSVGCDRTCVCVLSCAYGLLRSARFSGQSLYVIPQAHGETFFYSSLRAVSRLDVIAHVYASYFVRMVFFVPHGSVGSHCM